MKKNNKTLKRFLAFLLCAAMLITYMPSSVYTLADEETDTPEVAADSGDSGSEAKKEAPKKSEAPAAAPAEQAEPAPAAEPKAAAEPEESQVEEAQEPETPETRAGPSEDSEAAAEEATEETSEEAAPEGEEAVEEEAVEEEKEDEDKLNEKELNFTGKANSVNVKVVAQPGTFPEGTTMKVASVSKGAVKDAVEGALDDVNDFRAVDITFYADGKEVQPKKNVSVKLTTSAFDTEEDLNVVHIKDSGAAEVMDLTSATDTAAQFKSDSFSIYVVVGTGEDARLVVNFVRADGTTKQMMINKRQLDKIDVYIFDPGAHEPEGSIFKGWTTEEDYTSATTAKTISQVREDIKTQLDAGVSDGTEVTYYAMAFNSYEVTYIDERNIVVQIDQELVRTDSNEKPKHNVTLNYTPYPPEEDGVASEFKGWQQLEPEVSGEMKLYNPGDSFTLEEQSYKLKAYTQQGHWLSFDENLNGASYTEPQFVQIGQKPTAPTNPSRAGYSFDGWYTADGSTERDGTVSGNQFNFDQVLEANTTVYAKWVKASTAPYKVIIWKQNVDGEHYDYENTITVNGAPVGTTVNPVTAYGQGARINGTTYTYTGFHYDHHDTGVVVTAEGNAVVNVYFDRTEYTLTFRENRNGTVYKTITALYGQNIKDQFPITNNANDRWSPQNSSTFNQVLVYIDIMPAESVTFYRDNKNFSIKTIHYYIEAKPGQTATRTYNGLGFVEYKSIDAAYNWFTEPEDYIELVGFTKGTANSLSTKYQPQGYDGNSYSTSTQTDSTGNRVWNNDDVRHVVVYYVRNKYDIIYNDGIFVDGSGHPVADAIDRGEISDLRESGVPYEADIADKNKTPEYPGFVFLGWYTNKACAGDPYDFKTMPTNNVTLYAKWGLAEYTINLHPNDSTDDKIKYNSDTQAEQFWENDGGKVGNVGGERIYFDLVGWYTDPEFTHPFDFSSFVVNQQMVGKYGKLYSASEMDPDYPTTIGELNLYAKWRGKLIGSDGITIEYVDDATLGTGASVVDDNTYVDDSHANARGAFTPKDQDKYVFSHWEVQKWNGSAFVPSGVNVFPGESFEINSADAKITDENGDVVDPDDLDEDGSYTYRIQLKAVYVDKDKEVLTFINWYNNYDGGKVATSENIKINEATPIPAAPERDGYEFKGWIRGIEEEGPTTTLTDLWITYTEGSGYTYNGNPATNVAADEHLVGDGTQHHALYAKWEAVDVDYTVEFYYQNDNGEGYTKDDTLTATRQAKTDTTAEVTDEDKAQTKSGKYKLVNGEPSVFTATVAGDGSTVLKLYFELNQADVTVHHYLKGTTTKVADDVTATETIGHTYTASPVTSYQGKTLTLDEATSDDLTVTVAIGGNVINLYYTLPLKITTGSASKVYDGKPLTKNEASITGLLDADKITVKATGSQTKVGDSKNTYEASEAIPGYYVVSEELGTLTVTQSDTELKIESLDGEWTYDGNEHKKPEYKVTYGKESYTVKVEDEATTAVATLSTGDKVTITPAAAAKITHVAESKVDNEFTYVVDNADQFKTITKTVGKLTVNPATLTVKTESANKQYDGKELTAGGSIDGFVTPTGGSKETATFTVTGSQTVVGDSPNSYSITWDGTAVKTDYTISEDLGTLTVTQSDTALIIESLDGEWTYDGNEHKKPEYKVTYGKESYTVKVEGEATTAVATLSTGDKVTITPAAAAKITHAAETTVDNEFTYVVDNANQFKTITKTVGKLTVKPATLTVKTESANKVYDGTALTATGTISGFVTPTGGSEETATFTVTGSQTVVGNSQNSYSMTWDGTAVKTDYTISEDLGTLIVTASTTSLVIASSTKSWEYDGTAHTDPVYTVTYGEERGTATAGAGGKYTYKLSTGDTITITPAATATVTHVAEEEVTNAFSYELTNAGNYSDVKKTEGKLSITPAKLTVTTGNRSKIYDGTALTAEGSVTGYKNGEEADFTVTGTITNVGKTDNTYTLVFAGEEGASDAATAVRSDYTIEESVGELEVTRRTITYTSGTSSKVYDGVALTDNNMKVEGEFAPGEGATYEITGTQTLVGTSDNVFTVTPNEGTDFEKNYVIVKKYGTLTVTDGTNPPDDPVADDLVVTKTAEDKAYALGETVTFTITVTNIYSEARDITLTEIPGVTLAQSKFEGVAGGASKSTTATYTITEADILNGSFTNTVTAKIGESLTKKAEATVRTEDLDTTLTVNKKISNAPADGKAYKLGETIEYTITVTNDGNVAYKNIVVKDEGTGLNETITSLAPGEAKTFTTSHKVTEEDILAGSYTNTATAKADPIPDPKDPENPKTPEGEDTVTTGDEDDPDGPTPPLEDLDTTLTVNKTIANKPADGKAYKLGETIEYKITVTNDGNVAYKNIVVKDEGTGLNETITSLAPGEAKTFTTSHKVTEEDILAGSYTNTATAKADPIPDPKDPENPKTPEGEDTVTTGDEDDPDGPTPPLEDLDTTLTVNKTIANKPADGKAYKLGETIEYKITVTNDGNVTYKNIVVKDEGTGLDETITSLAPKATETFTTKHVVTEADILAGSYTNTATAKADPIPDPKDPENPKTPEGKDTVTTGDEDDPDGPTPPLEDLDTTLTVNKTIANKPADGKAYKLGETIEYKITVTNDGNVTYKNIAVKDEGTGLDETITSLAPKATETFTTKHVVTEADILAGSYTNTATAKADPIPDPKDPENPKTPEGKDTVTTGDEDDPDGPNPPVEPKNGHLSLKKETTSRARRSDGKYGLGETITYKITATNDGNLTLTDVKVVDELTNESWTVASLAPGKAETFTTKHVVTEADIIAGEVLNVATATVKSPDDDKPNPPVDPGKDPEPTEGSKPGISVTKTANRTRGLNQGDTVRYTITVKNTGNVTLKNINVTDSLVKFTGNKGKNITLAPGASAKLTYRYTVTAANVRAGRVVNRATARGTAPNGASVSGSDRVTARTAANGGGNPGGGNPGGGNPGGPAVTPAAPADGDAAVVPEEPVPEAEPEVEIEEPETPLAAGAWALVNLICAIATALGAIVALFRKKEEDDEDEDEQNKPKTDDEDEDDNRGKKMLASKIAGAVAGVAGPVAFILTEDMSLPMQMVDKWTLLMVVILAAQIVAAIFNKKASELDDEDEEEAGAAAN